MKDVADLMTTAVRAFGLEASDSAEISDIFASAVNKSKLTIDKLRTAFNYLGPIAKQADISLRETSAGAMILANAGFRASTIGTGFRQVIARLVAPSEKLKTVFKAAGADLKKLNPAANDFKVVIGELSKVLGEGISQTERARRAFALFGLRGASAASALAQAGEEGFEIFYKELGKVSSASEMAEKQMEGLGVMAKNLRDKFGILAVTMGEGGIAGVGVFRKHPEESRLVDYVGPAKSIQTKYLIVNAFMRECTESISLNCICTDREIKTCLEYHGFMISRHKPTFSVVSTIPGDADPEKDWFVMGGDSDVDLIAATTDDIYDS